MHPDTKRNIGLVVALILIAGAIYYFDGMKASRGSATGTSTPLVSLADSNASSTGHTPDFLERIKKYPAALELVSPTGFVNTDGKPIKLADYIGKKVILLDFWTYSCINCQRTLPYLTDWYKKYKDQGFIIIGVHTPEFEFEKDIKNVSDATKRFGIEYPVVLDSNFGTWDAYKNQYWPEHYLIDINGLVVDRTIGEGGYAETEAKIQALLTERKQALGESGSISTSISTMPTVAIQAQSPETYFGYARNEFLGNGSPNTPGAKTFVAPKTSEVSLNKLYLGGDWSFASEFAINSSANAHITYKYDAKSVYFVASASDQAKGVKITVLRDGKPIGVEKGSDVDDNGQVIIKESRLYSLVSESAAGTHTLEIIIESPGLEAFTFTFG